LWPRLPRSCTNCGNRCANRCTGWFDVIAFCRERIRGYRSTLTFCHRLPVSRGCFTLFPCAFSWARPRVRLAAHPRGLSHCSLFLTSFAPSSIKIYFAGWKYFVPWNILVRIIYTRHSLLSR
jgi:hypothetical protein